MENSVENNNPFSAPTQPTEESTPVMTLKDWLITLLLLYIPLVNFIMLFVWGFGGGANKNKQNFSRAALIWMAIGIVLYIIFGAIFVGIIASIARRSTTM